MRQVIFFTDVFKGSGFGHFIRCFALAEQFKKKNYKVFFISRNTSKSIKKIFKKKKISTLRSNILKTYSKNRKIVIVDSYNIKNNLINFINKFFFTVTFNDYDKKEMKSNIVIKNNLGQIKKKDSLDNHLIGKKYFIIKNEILKNKSNNIIKKKIKFCYITFGGYYKRNKVINFFCNLKKTQYFLNNSVKLYINIRSSQKKIKKIFQDSKNIKIEFVDLKINNNFKFNKIDMSINAGGVTSGEMVYLKIPQLVMCLSSNQNSNINFIKKNKLGSVAKSNILDKNIKIDSDINKFIKSYVKFKKNLMSKNYIDNHGAKRIVSKIIKAYKNEK